MYAIDLAQDDVPPPEIPLPPEDDWDRNDAGAATAMTLVTDLKGPLPAWLLRLGMAAFRHIGPAATDLQKTSFLHFAHWSVLSKVPSPLGRPTRRRLMLFESNFNDSWNDYVDVFCFRFNLGITTILRPSKRFTTLRPTSVFKDFMNRHELPAQHYYSAYPTATATIVRASLELEGHTEDLRLQAGTSTPVDFDRLLTATLARREVQGNLGGRAYVTPHGRDHLRTLIGACRNRAGATETFIAFVPVARETLPELRDRLRSLPEGTASPFAAVAGTHFGRFSVLDSAPRQSDEPLPPLLLLTAVFDGDGASGYLDDLLTQPDLRDIFEIADGWPNSPEQGRRYLERCRVDANFMASAYAGASVARVRAAVGFRRRFLDYLAGLPSVTEPAARQQAFVAILDEEAAR